MSGVLEFFASYINQPAPIGLALGVAFYYHTAMEDQKWEAHDKSAQVFKEAIEKKDEAFAKVEKYLLKFEDEQTIEKSKKVEHIVTVAKNSTSVIILSLKNMMKDHAISHLPKQEVKNRMIKMVNRNLSSTWDNLSSQGFVYEVGVMKEVAELLMPSYTDELEIILEVYVNKSLNGSKCAVLEKMLQALELYVINSWENYFKKLV